jgi:hypothetical protein
LIELLEYEDAIGRGSLNRGAIQGNFALHWPYVTTDGFEERRLTTTGRTEDNIPVRFLHVESYSISGSY